MYGWFAAPLVFVAGSRPAGHDPANAASSSTVISPPLVAAGGLSAPLLSELLSAASLLLPPQAESAITNAAKTPNVTGLNRCITPFSSRHAPPGPHPARAPGPNVAQVRRP
jgi:hypothetical protein